MSLTVWTQPSGFSFGSFPEEINFDQALPVSGDSGVTYSIISGDLPGGLELIGRRITGTPYIVSTATTSNFCIRATDGVNISDRTYSITITGVNPLEFVTAAGALAVGMHDQMYVLDSTYIDYQIEAFDLDIATGIDLTYFVSSGDGELPPGVTLSSSGLLSGFIKPTLRITPADGSGTYDNSYFDAVAYDFAVRPTNGFDTYQYDDVFYDYSLPSSTPTSINRNYQFKVTITDGRNYAQRIFRIFVVGEDQFRADAMTLDGFAGQFTADVTYLRQPAWITKSNLGVFRANNYITIPVALYDNYNTLFRLEQTNQEIYATTNQVSPTDNVGNSYTVTITNASGVPSIGQYFTFDNFVPGATGALYQISHVETLSATDYRLTITTPLLLSVPDNASFYIGSLCTLPPGTQFDINTGEIYGNVPYQPAITKVYKFTLTASRFGDKSDTVNSSRTFTISIIGEIDSVIHWNTPSDLGTVNANYISTLRVSATSTIVGAIVVYNLVDGILPPGLTLNLDGEIIGKINQYYNASTGVLGITTFDGAAMTFDHSTTTFNRVFTFSIQARDQYNYSALTQTFTVRVETPNQMAYSNIRTRPFLKESQRTLWKAFINNTTVFTPGSIYRTNDPAFGVQADLAMLVYAGIETVDAAAYVGAIGLNHKRKRFQFGSVKKAVAVDTGTNNKIYEVIYVEMIDPLEPSGKYLPEKLVNIGLETKTISVDSSNDIWQSGYVKPNVIAETKMSSNSPTLDRPDPIITIDSTGYQASNPNAGTYFPNSITNWQRRLSRVGSTERNYMPLWMRSIQPGTKQELGFTLAVPICYCQVGAADDILLNIKYSGFDFKNLDYTADRYIIDAVEGNDSDKYLVFRNDRITV
jgi:hypothetical protein